MSAELTELGARCRGNQHDDVINHQASTVADMRIRISDLEACVRQLNSLYCSFLLMWSQVA